jgi:N-acetylglutamate synthase-like GNAT family acetyltransferase
MHIRTARAEDRPAVRSLAESLGLDYPGMERDDFWVAEDDGRIVGICGFMRRSDCRELYALGVAKEARGRGIGADLVRALLAAVPGDIHLATVIPEFFEKTGFVRTLIFPDSMRKDPDWCEGCRAELCTVMVRKS